MPETHLSKSYVHFPVYAFLIDFGEEKHLYKGNIKWNRAMRSFRRVLKEVFGSEERYLLLRHSGSLARFDAQVMRLLGLEYSSDFQVIRPSGTDVSLDIQITDKGMQPASESPGLYLDDFLTENFASFVVELVMFYHANIT